MIGAAESPARAIEPLCKEAARKTGIGPAALRALRQMGRPEALANAAFAEPTFSVEERLQAITGLVAYGRYGPLLRLFDPERFLEKVAEDPRSPVRQQAQEIAERLRARTTLLCPSQAGPDNVLLRPAMSADPVDESLLMRASERPAEMPAISRPSWVRWR